MNEAERKSEDPRPEGEHFQPADNPQRFQGRLVAMAALVAVVIGGIIWLIIRHR